MTRQPGTRPVKTIAALVLLCFLPGYITAQKAEEDSLLSIIALNKRDTLQVQAYSAVGWIKFREAEYDEAVHFAGEAKELATALGYQKGLAASYNLSGVVYCEQGNYLPAADNFLNSLRINEKRNDVKAMVSSYGNLGIVHMYMKNYEKAKEYYRKSFELAGTIGHSRGQIGALLNIGLMCRQQERFEEGLACYYRALALMDSAKNHDAQGTAYLNMGNIYEDMADRAEEKGDKAGIIENSKKAEQYIHKALALAQEKNDRYALCHLHANLASVYHQAGKLDLAEQEIIKATAILDEIGTNNSLECMIHDVYWQILDKKGEHKKALYHFKQFKLLSDSLNADENRKQLIEKDLQYGYEKKEAELKAAAKAEQAVIEEAARAEKQKQQLISLAIAVGLVLSLIFGALIFNRFRVTKRQKSLIEAQKQEVEQKSREIQDSISYAKNVQKAILPSEQHFKEHFTSHFIFYRPKDVVAGDFYWLETLNTEGGEWVLVAAADATGHGVPGALVSVVCSNALNRAVHEHGLKNPGEVLDKTTDIVLDTFIKSDTSISDGMDISLLAIDKKRNKAFWSGANNGLCYASEGTFHELHGDKQPFGKSTVRKPFKTHEIHITNGTTFYLFTDGYADQFGGALGKKFKHKNLKELLSNISSDSMRNQKDVLSTKLDDWKRGQEQVDDVCVIGLRV